MTMLYTFILGLFFLYVIAGFLALTSGWVAQRV